MARLTATILMVWTLLLGPALCMGEVLEHACDCDHDVECEHEENCTTDPCSDVIRWREASESLEPAPTWAPALPPTCEPFQLADLSAACDVDPPPRAHRQRLPYPPSDVPLRI
jgi:hypothetical protein